MSGDVELARLRFRSPGPPVENTLYGVHISGMGFRLEANEKDGCDFDMMYIRLDCYIPKGAFRRAPVALILETIDGRNRPRCVRRGIVGLRGVPVPEAVKQLIEEKDYGLNCELVRLDAFGAKNNLSEMYCFYGGSRTRRI